MPPSTGGGQPVGGGGSPVINMTTPGSDAGTNPISTPNPNVAAMPSSATTDRGGNTGGSKSALGSYYLGALGSLDELEAATACTAATTQSALEEITTNVGTYTETLVLPEVISPTMYIGPRIDIALFGDEDFEDSNHFGHLGLQYITRTRHGGTQTNSMSSTNSNSDRGGGSYTYNSLTKRFSEKDHGLCVSYHHYWEDKKRDWLWYVSAGVEWFPDFKPTNWFAQATLSF